jgi:hypothetical protein
MSSLALPGLIRGPLGPVPYVTRWSGEQALPAPLVETATGLEYEDESPADRDTHGVLWSRVTFCPGRGEPRYRTLHQWRQRRAMRWLLCQVCGAPASCTERGALWLAAAQPGLTLERLTGAVTAQPPLCVRCTRISVTWCPWLRPGHLAFRAHSTISGVYGGVHGSVRPNARPQLLDVDHVALADGLIHWTQADQLLRTLDVCTPTDIE